jgi:hypothetical protein
MRHRCPGGTFHIRRISPSSIWRDGDRDLACRSEDAPAPWTHDNRESETALCSLSDLLFQLSPQKSLYTLSATALAVASAVPRGRLTSVAIHRRRTRGDGEKGNAKDRCGRAQTKLEQAILDFSFRPHSCAIVARSVEYAYNSSETDARRSDVRKEQRAPAGGRDCRTSTIEFLHQGLRIVERP